MTELEDSWDTVNEEIQSLRSEIAEIRKNHLIKEVTNLRRNSIYQDFTLVNSIISVIIMVWLAWFFHSRLTPFFGVLIVTINCLLLMLGDYMAFYRKASYHSYIGQCLEDIIRDATSVLDTDVNKRKEIPKQCIERLVRSYLHCL